MAPTSPALLVFIPFGVFVAGVITQLLIVHRLGRLLPERHPDLWLKLSRESSFLDPNPAYRFLRKRMDRGLDDPVISRLTRRHRTIFAFSIVAWLAFAVMIYALRS